jgi:cysteine-rich repeat protein
MKTYLIVWATVFLAACKFDPAGANYLPLDADAAVEPADAQLPPDSDDPSPPPGCGDGVVEPPEQCDDHGTTSGDGCSSSCRWESSACYPGAELAALSPGTPHSGSTAAQASGLDGGEHCGGAAAGEDIYTFELDERADVTVTTALPATDHPTVVYVRSDCNAVASQLGCSAADVLQLPALDPGSYFVIVDGADGAAGNYQVRVDVRPLRQAGEACDPAGESSRCDDGLVCDGTCVAAAPSCTAGALAIVLGGAGSNVQHGSTTGASGYAPACAASGSGPEKVFRALIGPGAMRDLVLDVRSTGGLAAIAEITSQCGDSTSSLACSPDAGVAVVDNVQPGEYFAVVDGAGGTSGGFDADFYLRPVLEAGASCDRQVRENRCGGSAVCVDGSDFDSTPTCTGGVPVLTEGNGGNSDCAHAEGPRGSDFVYTGSISGTGDVDVIALSPSLLANRIVASVYGPGGTCPLDLALELQQGECGETTPLASSHDEGLGACPYIDAALPFGGNRSYWLNVTRTGSFGTGSYTMVLDFIP